MIDIIAGAKGHGKTKILLQKVDEGLKESKGTIVYLDKNNKHMYELNRQIRLIVVPEYNISSTDMFLGFLLGIISQDHDLEKVYLDSFLTISCLEGTDKVEDTINTLADYSKKYDVDFVISASADISELPASVAELVSVAL